MVIEFDRLTKGIGAAGVGGRGKKRYRAVLAGPPEPGKWTHCSVPVSRLKLAPGGVLWEINFFGQADRSGESYILIDNMKIRQE